MTCWEVRQKVGWQKLCEGDSETLKMLRLGGRFGQKKLNGWEVESQQETKAAAAKAMKETGLVEGVPPEHEKKAPLVVQS